MWLAVDCGNSRLKWAAVADRRRSNQPAESLSPTLPRIRISDSARTASLQAMAAKASEAWVSLAGGDEVQQRITRALKRCPKVRIIRSPAKGGGVTNTYRPASSLGTDRFLAMVAVRQMQSDVIIISAGTAATVDALSATGVFLGGIVLPGIALMHDSLSARTNLPRTPAVKKPAFPPQNTRTAIATGAVSAITGAANILRQQLLPKATCILTGGDAKKLLPHFPSSTLHLPHLPIAGLIRLRESKQ